MSDKEFWIEIEEILWEELGRAPTQEEIRARYAEAVDAASGRLDD